jgi:hypothetical protein
MGIRVSAVTSAPTSAYPIVNAIGVNSLLSTRSKAKSGRYAVMMMRVAKKIGRATCPAAATVVSGFRGSFG